MSLTTLGTGDPYRAAIINTSPRQLRFSLKASEAFQIRIVYIPNPPAITADSDDIYVQSEWSEGVYLEFVRLVALSMGEDELAARYRLYYEDWLRKNRSMASGENRKKFKLGFSWL